MVILNISEVLPAPIPDKKRENDILLVTANKHKELYPEVKHVFVLLIPYVSWLTSFFYPKWKPHRALAQKGYYYINNKEKIYVLTTSMRGYSIPPLRPFLNWISYQRNKSSLCKLVNYYKPSIIHAHNVYNASNVAYRLSIKTKIPYIITSRNINSFSTDHQTSMFIKHAHAVININHIHKNIIDQLIPNTSSYLLPHGIDSFFFESSNLAARSNQSDTIHIVSICRLLRLKNIDQTLFALSKIKYPFVYKIYGEGPEMNHLKSIVSQLNLTHQVHFMGHVEHHQVANVLAENDIFIMPSYPETLGRIYLEAMCLRLPVIAAKHTGMDGYIINGENGYLVDHKNVNDLKETLEFLMVNKEKRISTGKAAQSYSKQFSWEVIIEKLHAIYYSNQS